MATRIAQCHRPAMTCRRLPRTGAVVRRPRRGTRHATPGQRPHRRSDSGGDPAGRRGSVVGPDAPSGTRTASGRGGAGRRDGRAGHHSHGCAEPPGAGARRRSSGAGGAGDGRRVAEPAGGFLQPRRPHKAPSTAAVPAVQDGHGGVPPLDLTGGRGPSELRRLSGGLRTSRSERARRPFRGAGTAATATGGRP